MKEVEKRLKRDRFAVLCGITINEIREGYASTSVMITDHHLNGVDITQGGLIYTLADVAFAAATNSYGPVAVGLTTNISFFNKSLVNDQLIATATVVAKSRRTCSVDVEVTCNNQLIAKMTGTAFIKV